MNEALNLCRSSFLCHAGLPEVHTDPNEAGRRVSDGFVPLISQIPGFVAYYWVDAKGGVMVSTSVFQDQTGAEESNKRAADWVRDNLAPLLPNAPQITIGEVVAHGAKEQG